MNSDGSKLINLRLTHSASELSGFACTSSLTMNEKLHLNTMRLCGFVSDIVSERGTSFSLENTN